MGRGHFIQKALRHVNDLFLPPVGVRSIIIFFFEKVGNGDILREVHKRCHFFLEDAVIHGKMPALLRHIAVFIGNDREKNAVRFIQTGIVYIAEAGSGAFQRRFIHRIFHRSGIAAGFVNAVVVFFEKKVCRSKRFERAELIAQGESVLRIAFKAAHEAPVCHRFD